MSSTLRHATTVSRYLLGLIFFVFGLNGFLHFLPTPPIPGEAGAFIGALIASGFLMPVVKLVETTAGALLLANRFVPLSLALLAPIVVAINGFHIALAPAGGGVAYLSLVLELFLAFRYRDAFKPMLKARVSAVRADDAIDQASLRAPGHSAAHA